MRENKAITLIALVVTIIVLLILASVSLNLVLGEHGIITMAKAAKENMELAQIEEETAFNTLQEELDNENWIGSGNTGNSGDTGGGQQVPKDDENVGKLVTEALKVDSSATEAGKKSPYIKYNNMICRVLYDTTSEYGFQIIADDNVTTIKLGVDDENPDVKASNFKYTGSLNLSEDFKKAADSYNKIVTTVQKKLDECKDSEGIAIQVRSVGTSPNFDDVDGEMTWELSSYALEKGFNHTLFRKNVGLNDSPILDGVDRRTMSRLKLFNDTMKKSVIPFRSFACYQDCFAIGLSCYGLNYTDGYIGESTPTLAEVSYSQLEGVVYSNREFGVRPVFKLDPKVKIKSGNGLTPETAYELELEK